eukprot:1317728-Rhodomonas_salina.1
MRLRRAPPAYQTLIVHCAPTMFPTTVAPYAPATPCPVLNERVLLPELQRTVFGVLPTAYHPTHVICDVRLLPRRYPTDCSPCYVRYSRRLLPTQGPVLTLAALYAMAGTDIGYSLRNGRY